MKHCKNCKWDHKKHPFLTQVCPNRRRYEPGIANNCLFYQYNWWKLIRKVITTILAFLIFFCAFYVVTCVMGRMNHKVTLPNGRLNIIEPKTGIELEIEAIK